MPPTPAPSPCRTCATGRRRAPRTANPPRKSPGLGSLPSTRTMRRASLGRRQHPEDLPALHTRRSTNEMDNSKHTSTGPTPARQGDKQPTSKSTASRPMSTHGLPTSSRIAAVKACRLSAAGAVGVGARVEARSGADGNAQQDQSLQECAINQQRPTRRERNPPSCCVSRQVNGPGRERPHLRPRPPTAGGGSWSRDSATETLPTGINLFSFPLPCGSSRAWSLHLQRQRLALAGRDLCCRTTRRFDHEG